jgi:hypothetical protein
LIQVADVIVGVDGTVVEIPELAVLNALLPTIFVAYTWNV